MLGDQVWAGVWAKLLQKEASHTWTAVSVTGWTTNLSRCRSDFCFHTVCSWVVFLPFYQKQHNSLRVLSQPTPLTFKIPGFKPFWLRKIMKIHPLLFSKPIADGVCFPMLPYVLVCLSPFSVTLASFQLQQPQSFSPLNHISSLPTLFYVSFPLPLVVELVLPVFNLNYVVFKMIW